MKKIALLSLLALSANLAHADTVDLNDGLIGYWPLNGDTMDYSPAAGRGLDSNDDPIPASHGTLLGDAHFTSKPGTGAVGQVLQAVYHTEPNVGHMQVIMPAELVPPTSGYDYEGSGAFWVWFDTNTGSASHNSYQGLLKHIPGIGNIRWFRTHDCIITQMRDLSAANTWLKSPEEGDLTVANTGQWYHIAWTLDTTQSTGGHFRYYINGVADPITYTDIRNGPSSTDFRIAADPYNYSNDLKMAEVRLYDRILNADEIAALADETAFLAADAPPYSLDETVTPTVGDVIDPASLLTFVDSDGNPLSPSNIPGDITYFISSGPVVIDQNGNLVFLGGGPSVIGAEVNTGNDYVNAGTYTASIDVPGNIFNDRLWDDSTGTGYYIIQEAMEAGVATWSMEAMRIDSDGNVGIGVTDPMANLHVKGDTRSEGLFTADAGIRTSGDIILNEGTSNEIKLGADGTATFPVQGDISMGSFGN